MQRCAPMISEKPVRLLGLAALVVLSMLVAGCPATTPTTPQATDGARTLEERARQAEAAGDARTAMQLYRGLADQSRGQQRARYLIDAARLAIELGDRAVAMQWLRDAGSDADAPEQQAIAVLLADIDVREGRAANALARLNQLREPLPTRVMTDAQGVRGRALFALDRVVEAVEVLVERETWLETSDEILENQRLIWEGLSSPRAASAAPTGDPLVDGWLALAPV